MHLALRIPDRRQQRRHLTGQPTFPQASSQLQHRPLMAHHLAQSSGAGALHGEHWAGLLTHRRQLRRITDEHQPGLEGVSALKGDPEKRAVDHGGLYEIMREDENPKINQLVERLESIEK